MLRMSNISKRYGSTVALDAVDFSVDRGEVVALLGENGAGKSTLVKVLAGLEVPDAGTIEIDGRRQELGSSARARAAGIAYVAQELSIIDDLTVAENVFLGDPGAGWIRSPARLARKAQPLLERLGLGTIDLLQPAGELSVAERQLVEIARLLSRQSRIAILDEPTAALADVDIARVENAVSALAAHGCAVIYVTHRLGEVFRLSQRVSILRNGKSFPALATTDITVDQLIERMLGRKLDQMFPPRATVTGDIALSLTDCLADGLKAPVSLTLKRGEILGFAGQVGSGAGTVVRMMAGVEPLRGGQMKLGGASYAPGSIRAAVARGVAYCSDDRKRDGIFAGRAIVENLTSTSLVRVSPFGLLSRARERDLATSIAGRFEIDAGRLSRLAGGLSGGNQQKVALGKWLGVEPQILLVEEPTRGVDVGARAEIYRHLRVLAERGLAVVFASSDTQEVHGLADRIATFFHGRLVRVDDAVTMSLEDITRDVTHPFSSGEAA